MDKIMTPTISQIQIGDTTYDLVDKFSKETLSHSIIKKSYGSNNTNIQEWIEINDSNNQSSLKNKINYDKISMTDTGITGDSTTSILMEVPYFEVGVDKNNPDQNIKYFTFGERLALNPKIEGEILNVGQFSVVEGKGAATADYSYSAGENTIANAKNSHAEGEGTRTNAVGSHAEGKDSRIEVEGEYSHAEGTETIARGISSHAEGYKTIASGHYSHAEGGTGKVRHQLVIKSPVYVYERDEDGEIVLDENDEPVIVYEIDTNGNTVPAIAYYEENFEEIDLAIQEQTESRGLFSHAEGFVTHAEGNNAHSEGAFTIASGLYSHAEGGGYITQIENEEPEAGTQSEDDLGGNPEAGENSESEDDSENNDSNINEPEGVEQSYEPFTSPDFNIPDYKFQIVSTEAIGQASHAEGFATKASGDHSHSEGSETEAKSEMSHAEGDGTIASGIASHAEGGNTEASGDYSHAEGAATIAFGDYSHAEGRRTKASGSSSHAEGEGSETIGKYSHAEGQSTEAIGNYSHAEGNRGIAEGAFSHVEGQNSEAIGTASHAEGRNTKAIGDYSHAQNQYTIANSNAQTAIGRYNIEDSNKALIIGNGSNDQRSNALTVDWNGGLSLISNNIDRLVPPPTGGPSSTPGDAHLYLRDKNQLLISNIYPQMLPNGTTQSMFVNLDATGTYSNYIGIGCTSTGDPVFYVKNDTARTAFRKAITGKITNSYTVSDGILSAGAITVVNNNFTATVYMNGIKLQASLANGSSTDIIVTLIAGERPSVATYVPMVVSTNGVPNGIFASILSNGELRIWNRSGAAIPTSYTLYGTITYTI